MSKELSAWSSRRSIFFLRCDAWDLMLGQRWNRRCRVAPFEAAGCYSISLWITHPYDLKMNCMKCRTLSTLSLRDLNSRALASCVGQALAERLEFTRGNSALAVRAMQAQSQAHWQDSREAGFTRHGRWCNRLSTDCQSRKAERLREGLYMI